MPKNRTENSAKLMNVFCVGGYVKNEKQRQIERHRKAPNSARKSLALCNMLIFNVFDSASAVKALALCNSLILLEVQSARNSSPFGGGVNPSSLTGGKVPLPEEKGAARGSERK